VAMTKIFFMFCWPCISVYYLSN